MKGTQRFPLLLGIMLFAFLLIGGIREIMLLRLPIEEIRLSSSVSQEIEIPERPGIGEIVITGPRIQPLLFRINMDRGGLRFIDWNRLIAMDPHGTIQIRIHVDEEGDIHFSQDDVKMGGHPEVGRYIQQIIRTWGYTPFMTGTLTFWFNLPSRGARLTIDTRQLRRRNTISEEIPIRYGALYLIEGIQSHEVQVIY